MSGCISSIKAKNARRHPNDGIAMKDWVRFCGDVAISLRSICSVRSYKAQLVAIASVDIAPMLFVIYITDVSLHPPHYANTFFLHKLAEYKCA